MTNIAHGDYGHDLGNVNFPQISFLSSTEFNWIINQIWCLSPHSDLIKVENAVDN